MNEALVDYVPCDKHRSTRSTCSWAERAQKAISKYLMVSWLKRRLYWTLNLHCESFVSSDSKSFTNTVHVFIKTWALCLPTCWSLKSMAVADPSCSSFLLFLVGRSPQELTWKLEKWNLSFLKYTPRSEKLDRTDLQVMRIISTIPNIYGLDRSVAFISNYIVDINVNLYVYQREHRVFNETLWVSLSHLSVNSSCGLF